MSIVEHSLKTYCEPSSFNNLVANIVDSEHLLGEESTRSKATFGGLLRRKALDHNYKKIANQRSQGMQHEHKAMVETTIIFILSN